MRTLDAFAGLSHGPAEEFRVRFCGAVLLLRELAGDPTAVPGPYLDELRACGGLDNGSPTDERRRWEERLGRWAAAAPTPLPAERLRRSAALESADLAVLFLCGLGEEDPRFGRPTAAWLAAGIDDPAEKADLRRAIGRLTAAELIHLGADAGLHVDPTVWEALRGERPVGVVAAADLPDLDDLVLSSEARRRVLALIDAVRAGATGAIVVRGAPQSGRGTLLRAIARRLGLGALTLPASGDEWSRARVGAVATLLGVMPILDAAPRRGEGPREPTGTRLPCHHGVVGIRSLPGSAIDGDAVGAVELAVPDPNDRLAHWTHALPGHDPHALRAVARAHRLRGGTIRRVAGAALTEARAAGRSRISPGDVTAAIRSLRPDPLGELAARVPVRGGWADLVAAASTVNELRLLEQRCHARERLPAMLPESFGEAQGPGVRALFSGPSGTGKTLSARLLASVLGKDLHRLDLSGVVNKYLGETEKNLDRVFGVAAELDVVLLLDEGDVLLGRRTDVSSSNDRYANMETNYLLQRLESFDGIVIITTNAAQHIDRAFERRLDVVVEFTAPGPAQREALWLLHLPPLHTVDACVLGAIAGRCSLTGGQVRNAILHASLLALGDGGTIGTAHVVEAVRREYRKTGAVCPLRVPEPGTGRPAALGQTHG